MESIVPINVNIVKNTCVAEANKPYSNYCGVAPFNMPTKPNSIYLFTEHYYTLEEAGKNFERLAMLEELKTMPFGGVWDYYCLLEGVSTGMDYIDEIQQYEKEVLSKR